MHIDIVITTHSRAALLRNCLDSIESNFINGLSIQVLIVINGSDAETEGLLSKLNYQNIKIDYQTTAKKLNGAARNLALKKISGDWVLFIDDDATLPANYFKDFLQIVNQEPEIDILGGK
jgi:glycosyltransferase involved in cell wall biosynthesis